MEEKEDKILKMLHAFFLDNKRSILKGNAVKYPGNIRFKLYTITFLFYKQLAWIFLNSNKDFINFGQSVNKSNKESLKWNTSIIRNAWSTY